MSTLGARLRHLRREQDCTLQEVSEGSGLTPSFLSRLERGIVNISVGNLRKVAAFFGVPITYFFTEDMTPHGMVVRAAKRTRQETGPWGWQESLLPREAAHLSAEVVSMAPSVTDVVGLAPSSRALYYVLEGRISCVMGGQQVQLSTGDVVYQRRPAALRWSNGVEQALLLVVSLQSEEK